MKRLVLALVARSLVASILALPLPASAWDRGFDRFHHFHHFHRNVVFFGFGVGPFVTAPFWYPPAYAYPVYAYQAPTYVAPPTYAPAPPPPTPPAVWYYCQSLGAYYPNVPSCPEAWVPVPAQ